MSDLFNSERLLLDKMNIRIKLFKNDEAFCLMGPTLNKFKIDIQVQIKFKSEKYRFFDLFLKKRFVSKISIFCFIF